MNFPESRSLAEPFQRRLSAGDGPFTRLLGRRAKGGAIQEIEDLLARAERVSDVAAEQLTELAERHGLDLSRRMRTPRKNLYRRFLEHCLVDQALSAEETDDLAHLRMILQLQELDAARVHDEVARAVYGHAIDHVLEDHRLDPDEAEFLKRLRDELEIPEEVGKELLQEGEARARERYLFRAVSHEGPFLLAAREAVLHPTGTSEGTIEEAVQSAVEEAAQAVPQLDLRWVELNEVRAEIEKGRVAKWHVKLRAVLSPED